MPPRETASERAAAHGTGRASGTTWNIQVIALKRQGGAQLAVPVHRWNLHGLYRLQLRLKRLAMAVRELRLLKAPSTGVVSGVRGRSIGGWRVAEQVPSSQMNVRRGEMVAVQRFVIRRVPVRSFHASAPPVITVLEHIREVGIESPEVALDTAAAVAWLLHEAFV